MSRFTRLFGPKPILAGVYPTGKNPVDRMVGEVMMLSGLGVSGVYLENIHRTQDDIRNMGMALEELYRYTHKSDLPYLNNIKIGVNILPDHKGTEYKKAFQFARMYSLNFVALDAIAGKYKIGDDEIELDVDGYLKERKFHSNTFVLGGIFPPYAQSIGTRDMEYYLEMATDRSDAVMVKTQRGEQEIPLERIAEYAGKKHGIVIGASKISSKNLRKYFPVVDGFVIGSSLRDGPDGQLNISFVEETVGIRNEAIAKLNDY